MGRKIFYEHVVYSIFIAIDKVYILLQLLNLCVNIYWARFKASFSMGDKDPPHVILQGWVRSRAQGQSGNSFDFIPI